MIRNEKGFALAMTMALLPFLIAGFFLAWASVGFVQQDLALKYACRSEGIAGQKKVAPNLAKLLKLNPDAKRLKEELVEIDREIEFAIVHNQAALPGLSARRLVVEGKRLTLDIKQTKLIQESNRSLKSAHSLGRSEIQSNASSTSTSFINLKMGSISGKAPKLAVRPDYPDIAPTYSPTFDFANEQALAHEWQYTATIARPFSLFLPGQFNFKKACAVTLKKELTQWTPQIIKARFSLKSVW